MNGGSRHEGCPRPGVRAVGDIRVLVAGRLAAPRDVYLGRFSETHLPVPPGRLFPQLMCSSVQKALFEEEDHVKKLQQKVATLEKRNRQLRDRVKKVKRSLRQARKNGRHLELVNQKLSEKLAAAAGAIPHINALGREPARSSYLRG